MARAAHAREVAGKIRLSNPSLMHNIEQLEPREDGLNAVACQQE